MVRKRSPWARLIGSGRHRRRSRTRFHRFKHFKDDRLSLRPGVSLRRPQQRG
jgi:hypothetical protein